MSNPCGAVHHDDGWCPAYEWYCNDYASFKEEPMIDAAIRDRLAETRNERTHVNSTQELNPTEELIDALYEAFGHLNVWKVEPVHRGVSVPAGETWLMITNGDMVDGMVCIHHLQEPVAHVNDYYDGLRLCLEESDLDHEFIESEGTYRVTLPTT